jgi:hypothetical protein
VDIFGTRNLLRHQRNETVRPPERDHKTERAADHRQKHTFAKQLSNDASAPSTDGHAHCNFARP